MEQSLMDKLTILADSAKYDVACTSSGASHPAKRGTIGSCYAPGCCHAFTADGRCVSLLKVLMSNCCAFDCSYCVNRKSNDVPRATFSPRELAELTIEFYRRNYIEGLFLSSAVLGTPDYTTERMLTVLRLLRNEYHFGGYIHAKAKNGRMCGTQIYLDIVSVGATMNIMLAAVLADGLTVIENAAKEPHIVDLANFLNSMGANIMGAGTDVIKVRGVEKMHGCTYSIIPDQIEAGSYMVAAAATGGDVLIKNVTPKHLEPITAKLRRAGVDVEEFDDSVRVSRKGDILPLKINTMPHPGFPTDMQPLMGVLLSVAKGTSTVTESVWDNRFRYVDELRKMGANVQVDGQVAVFEGVEKLSPAPLRASDLRAGAAMVVAALMADGTSEIEEIGHIERGYENIVEKLRGLGADIRKVERMPAALEQAL